MHYGSLFEKKKLSSIFLESDSCRFLGNLQAFFLANLALLLGIHWSLGILNSFRQDESSLSISAILCHVLSDRYPDECPSLALRLIVYCDRQELLVWISREDGVGVGYRCCC